MGKGNNPNAEILGAALTAFAIFETLMKPSVLIPALVIVLSGIAGVLYSIYSLFSWAFGGL